jgi:hypothetical protein
VGKEKEKSSPVRTDRGGRGSWRRRVLYHRLVINIKMIGIILNKKERRGKLGVVIFITG